VAARSWRLAARRAAIVSRPSKAGLGFPRDARLAHKAQFDAVYRTGKRRTSSHFTLFLKPNDLPLSRFGFSIKKALGGAVLRNRMRRRMREIVRVHRNELPAGWDVVIHPKSSVAEAAFDILTADFLRLMKV
jgi:ribonuclease P protein component